MENYLGSQQHWEDNINDDYDERERMNAEQKDNRVQPDPREQQQPSECGGEKPEASENTLPIQNVSKSCQHCNGRGYFINHFDMKVNCRNCYGSGHVC